MKQKNEKFITIILKEISSNQSITQKQIAIKYSCSERKVRRYFKILKDNNIIILEKIEKKKIWKIKKA